MSNIKIMDSGSVTFRVDRRKVLKSLIPIYILVGLNLLNLAFKIYRWQVQHRPFDDMIWFLLAYAALAAFMVWFFRITTRRHIELTKTEIKQIGPSGGIDKSSRWDEITSLKLGESLEPTRSRWMVLANGKKWLVPHHSENYDALVRLLEERSGKSFEEPIAGTVKRNRNVRIGE